MHDDLFALTPRTVTINITLELDSDSCMMNFLHFQLDLSMMTFFALTDRSIPTILRLDLYVMIHLLLQLDLCIVTFLHLDLELSPPLYY